MYRYSLKFLHVNMYMFTGISFLKTPSVFESAIEKNSSSFLLWLGLILKIIILVTSFIWYYYHYYCYVAYSVLVRYYSASVFDHMEINQCLLLCNLYCFFNCLLLLRLLSWEILKENLYDLVKVWSENTSLAFNPFSFNFFFSILPALCITMKTVFPSPNSQNICSGIQSSEEESKQVI